MLERARVTAVQPPLPQINNVVPGRFARDPSHFATRPTRRQAE